MTALGLLASVAFAQPSAVEWSGLAFIDYSYLLAADAPGAEGANGFDYRRIYLTADASLDDDLRARVRLEAQGRSTTAQGRPAPFVKDAWIRWTYAPSGHRAQLGVQPPPLFQVSEQVWGYRSLARTLVDRAGIRDSRDLGLRLDGPLAAGGDLRYAVMVGNGNGVGPEAPGDRGKRVYGQLGFAPNDAVRATLGADYESSTPAGGVRQESARISAFVGAVTERYRVGTEAYVLRTDTDPDSDATEDGFGVSVFGVVEVAPRVSVIARYDYLDDDAVEVRADEHYVLGAVSYRISPAVWVMPNVTVTLPDDQDAHALGRVTTYVRF